MAEDLHWARITEWHALYQGFTKCGVDTLDMEFDGYTDKTPPRTFCCQRCLQAIAEETDEQPVRNG